MRKTKLQTYFNRKVKSITFQSARRNFLSEGVRCGASQKKPPKDSTRSTALGGSFWDVPQMCHLSQEIHKKLLAAGALTFVTCFGK